MNDVYFTRTEDVELLLKLRADFCFELHPETAGQAADSFLEHAREYFRKALEENRYIGYAGYCQKTLCGGAAVLIYDLPPYTDPWPRKIGHILNFFVYPQFRKQGIGNRMIQFIIDDTANAGFSRLVLNATQAGEPVYRKHGFHEPHDTYLFLDLPVQHNI